MSQEIRRRFFVNGEASKGTREHGDYFQMAASLLQQTRGLAGIAQSPSLRKTFTTHTGVTLTARVNQGDFDEVWIDLPHAKVEHKPQDKPALKPERPPIPYLWIGLKQLNNNDRVKLHACLYEPGAKTEDAQVLSNRGKYVGFGDPNEDDVPIGAMKKFEVGEDYLEYGKRGGYVIERKTGASLMYDPLDKDAAKQWDLIIVIDPYEDTAIVEPDGQDPRPNIPTDDRKVIAFRDLEAQTGITGLQKIMGGQYSLVIAAEGDDCEALPDTEVEIEVRTLKLPEMTRTQHTAKISEQTSMYRGLLPGGYYLSDDAGCEEGYGGRNPHRPHWWAGAILCSPNGGATVEDSHLPAWGFGTSAQWPSHINMCGPFQSYFYPYVQGYWSAQVTDWKDRPWVLGYFECYQVTVKYELHMTGGSAVDPTRYPSPFPSSAPVYNLDLSKQPFVAATWQNGFSGDQIIASSTQTWSEGDGGRAAFFNGGGGNPGVVSVDAYVRPLAEAELNRPITFGGEGSWGASGMMWWLPWPEPGGWESVPTQFIYHDPGPNTMVINAVAAEAYYEAQGRMGPKCA